MPDRSTPHHSTTNAVTQTLLTYEKDAETFLRQWGRKKYRRPPLLKEWVALLPKRAVVLDLGCGAGQDTRYLATLGHRVVGLDRTMPLLRFARQRSALVPFVLADMRTLPIRAGALDGIWAAAALMHVPKSVARSVLSELRARVQPNGLLAATVTHGVNSGSKQKAGCRAAILRVGKRTNWPGLLRVPVGRCCRCAWSVIGNGRAGGST